MTVIQITKASGEQEPFDESKLRRSLQSANADDESIEQIVKAIGEMLYDGISTQKIYREAFKLLRKRSRRSAGRYKLKEAMLEFGPTGYPFEKFIAEVLNRSGYQVETGVVVEGHCVSHEIDVIASRENTWFLVECKFHNRKGHTCNVKVPLYIQSRFQDVKVNWSKQPGHAGHKHHGWVVTNTRFTTDAITYGECIGLKLLSWDYPKRNGLKDLIARVNLHPITCLSSLNRSEKQHLLEQDVVLCSQPCEDSSVLDGLNLDSRKRKRVLEEALDICDIPLGSARKMREESNKK